MKERSDDQSMFYLDYRSLDDIPWIIDYLKKKSGKYAIYFNGITIAFSNDRDREAFVSGLECMYNVLRKGS